MNRVSNMNRGTRLMMHFPHPQGCAYFSAPTVSAKNMRHWSRMRRSSAVHVELQRFILPPPHMYLPRSSGFSNQSLVWNHTVPICTVYDSAQRNCAPPPTPPARTLLPVLNESDICGRSERL